METDHYSVLGIKPGSSYYEAKAAYLKRKALNMADSTSNVAAKKDLEAIEQAWKFLSQSLGHETDFKELPNADYDGELTTSKAEEDNEANEQFKRFYAYDSLVYILLVYLLPIGIVTTEVWWYINVGIGPLIASCFLLLILFPFWIRYAIKEKPFKNYNDLKAAIQIITSNHQTLIFVLAIFNVASFFLFSKDAVIPFWILKSMVIITIVYTLGTAIFPKLRDPRIQIPIILLITFINLFLTINALITKNEFQEKYHYKIHRGKHGQRGELSSEITLEYGKYEENNHIRMFLEFKPLYGRNTIIYTFAKGIFGIKQLKSYRLEYEKPPPQKPI